MMVRAKFKVDEIKRTRTSVIAKNEDGTIRKTERGDNIYTDGELQTVVMSPVYSSDPDSENAKFWQASPSGKIELGCVNLDAGKYFELSKEYYIDFTKAE